MEFLVFFLFTFVAFLGFKLIKNKKLTKLDVYSSVIFAGVISTTMVFLPTALIVFAFLTFFLLVPILFNLPMVILLVSGLLLVTAILSYFAAFVFAVVVSAICIVMLSRGKLQIDFSAPILDEDEEVVITLDGLREKFNRFKEGRKNGKKE